MFERARLRAVCGGLGGWLRVEAHIERFRFSRIAKDLAMLRLWNDGTLAPLHRIANGRGQRADLREIFSRMQNMGGVAKAGERLRRARYNEVSSELGIRISSDLDRVLTHTFFPDGLRPRLTELIKSGQCTTKPGECTPETVRQVTDLTCGISDYNRLIETVHEAIRPKTKQAPTPHSGAQKNKRASRSGTAKG